MQPLQALSATSAHAGPAVRGGSRCPIDRRVGQTPFSPRGRGALLSPTWPSLAGEPALNFPTTRPVLALSPASAHAGPAGRGSSRGPVHRRVGQTPFSPRGRGALLSPARPALVRDAALNFPTTQPLQALSATSAHAGPAVRGGSRGPIQRRIGQTALVPVRSSGSMGRRTSVVLVV